MDGDRRRDAAGDTEAETVEDRLERLVRDGRANALVAWAMVAVLVGVLVESALDADLLAGAIVVGLGAVVLAPTVAARDWRAMLPAELVGLALLPVLVRALLGGELGTFATYVAIAALALVVTVDLHMFTTLRVTHWFAVVFVMLATLATAAVWTVLRWNIDRTTETAFLTTNEALMTEWIYVTLAGIAAGLLFDGYFRRRGRRLRRTIRRVVRR
ncbi:hypothetical protein C471_13171 [Halorubrum saccharovorum DSM 1137]|uniref:Uncharacterized protein n=1 Tax=Halorubrum saccharovorum DSM 1137 TaxID=1227484 RepID=M0DT91_9EURY|nr:hypothetical protein [Halorubrum saccharovorum]ELZ37349.1 hypothetical protein C471_13171 [Halorubrum saccharovorum DSM 1137]